MKHLSFVSLGIVLVSVLCGTASATAISFSSTLAPADSVETANELIIEAQQMRNAAEYDRAAELLDEARPYVESLDDAVVRYRFHTESGHLNRTLGNYEEARAHYHTLMEHLGEEDVREKAVTLNNIAATFLSEDLLEDAIRYQRRSLEYRYDVSENRELGLAVSYFSLGRSLYRQRRYQDSNRYHGKAIEYMKHFEHPALEFNVLNSMGDLQSQLGNYDGARLYYEEAQEIAQDMGPREQAQILMDLGTNHQLTGDFDKAEELYARAMELFRELNIPFAVPAYMQVAELHLSRLNIEEARHWLDESGERLQRFPGRLNQAVLYEYEGLFHYLTYDHETADRKFNKAIEIYRRTPGYRLWPAVYWKQAFNMMEMDASEGYRLAEEAHRITEEHRMSMAVSGHIRAEAFQGLSDFYARLARRYVQDGKPSEAFRIMELSKSRGFAEDLALMPRLMQEALDEDESERHQQIRSDIIRLENQILASEDESQISRKLRQIEDFSLEGERLFSEALKRNEGFRVFFTPETESLAHHQRQLPEGSAGLHFSLSSDGLTGLLFTRDQVVGWTGELTKNEASALADSLRETLTRNRDRDVVNEQLASAADRLFSRRAIELLENADVDLLYVSTDGALAYIPLEALRPRNEYYLIERMPVLYSPSFTVRDVLAGRSSERRFRGKALALVNPEYSDSPDQTPAYVRGENFLRPLPFSRLEGDWVSDYFPGETALLSGKDARKTTFREQNLKEYDVLHFAAHGILDERNPRFSGIVLTTPDNPDEYDDGFLRTSEIYSLDLDAGLVVLSACNTGLGKVVNGEGVFGFQRAFMFAGSGSVAVTLWNIQDRSTSLLMRSFYRNLQSLDESDNNNPAAYAKALRNARLDLLSQRSYSHPAHWASFVLTGY